ncbi:alpha/beta fold hydrolase [Rhodovulum sp. DZ06]|uniref:alpha/beta fold hydrolase n=1 Tax=Rhodovulum sp. DZ06 TaxID=3425126 RepID=UPI003D33373A
MPIVSANGLKICVEQYGARRGAPLVLINALGMQLTSWPTSFLDHLAERGFRLIVFDPRDAGLSEGAEAAGRPGMAGVLAARLLGLRSPAPYTLSDMAADVAALIGAMGLESAHVLGVSMGGTIAQLLAIEHPARVRSLTIISSTSGRLTLPRASRAARAALAVPLPDPAADMQSYLDAVVRLLVSLGSPGWTPDPEELRARIRADMQRAWRPDGVARQRAAMLAAPGRERQLARLRLPVTVIHGRQDPLHRIEAGRAVAAAIPGAEMVEIDGMGHDLPEPVLGEIAGIVARTAARAGARLLPGAPLDAGAPPPVAPCPGA